MRLTMIKRNTTSKYTIALNTRIDNILDNAIKQYMKDTDCTKSEAIRELLLHGINHYYFID